MTTTSTDVRAAIEQELAVLDHYLDMAEARRVARVGEYADIPANNQGFFLVSDSTGIVRMDVDASFIAEQVFLEMNTSLGRPLISPNFTWLAWTSLAIVDLSSGRNYTGGSYPSVTAPAAIVNDPTIFIPGMLLSPQGYGDGFEFNADCWYDLPSELQIPKGGVFQFKFVDAQTGLDPTTESGTNFGPLRVTLVGRKVTG